MINPFLREGKASPVSQWIWVRFLHEGLFSFSGFLECKEKDTIEGCKVERVEERQFLAVPFQGL